MELTQKRIEGSVNQVTFDAVDGAMYTLKITPIFNHLVSILKYKNAAFKDIYVKPEYFNNEEEIRTLVDFLYNIQKAIGVTEISKEKNLFSESFDLDKVTLPERVKE